MQITLLFKHSPRIATFHRPFGRLTHSRSFRKMHNTHWYYLGACTHEFRLCSVLTDASRTNKNKTTKTNVWNSRKTKNEMAKKFKQHENGFKLCRQAVKSSADRPTKRHMFYASKHLFGRCYLHLQQQQQLYIAHSHSKCAQKLAKLFCVYIYR